MAEPAPKRARCTMPADLRDVIEKSLSAIGQVEFRKRSHKKSEPVTRCLSSEELVHEQTETLRKGTGNRVHFVCSNPKCEEPIRNDKWETHVLKQTSDRHLQESPEDVLERSMNFAPDGEWDTKESRSQRIVTFMEQRHYLALARQYGESDLAQGITDANRFLVRLTNMVRSTDPTSKILLSHYAKNYKPGSVDELANLILNIVFLRNTMSKEMTKMCEQGRLPWLRVEEGRVAEESKKAADQVFLALGGCVFFGYVNPMKCRSKAPRRGWGELVSELVAFAKKARELASSWLRDRAVEEVAAEIRRMSGFGGKGFRMKEILLDLAEATRAHCPSIDTQLVDFGVVGPGPRRALNFVNNRRWFDFEQDRSPTIEAMYVTELREFRAYLVSNTDVAELKSLNLLGVQFVLCEASKYIFYLRYESGSLYRPSSRDIEVDLQAVAPGDEERLGAIWNYWEAESSDEEAPLVADDLHPDYRLE